MSRANVDVVRSVYDAWARDEFPGPADLLDGEIEYVNPPGAVEPGIRHGLAASRRCGPSVKGRVVRYEWFHEPADAAEAMGLRE